MSENISLPAARVPLVDDKGMITREWLTLLSGLFRRVGGPVGFSNSELYGDAVALQSYDELLERISSLEAQNRNLSQAVQMISMGLVPSFDRQARAEDNVFDTITVRGDAQLSRDKGVTKVRGGVAGSTAKLQVGGDLDVAAGARIRGNATVDGNASSGGTSTAAAFHVGGVKVVGARAAGVAAYTAYAGQTVAATYTQSQAQATDNAIKNASTKLAQVVTALRTHGLVGD